MATIEVVFTEEERQGALLALGKLAAERPGWDAFLGAMADKLMGRDMYEFFRDQHREPAPA